MSENVELWKGKYQQCVKEAKEKDVSMERSTAAAEMDITMRRVIAAMSMKCFYPTEKARQSVM